MSSRIKTSWYRMIERVKNLPASWRQRAAPDPDRNDEVLGNLSESDPTYRAMQDHAFNDFSNEITAALDMSKPAAMRISHLDRAAALAGYLTNVESVRDRARVDAQLRRQQAQSRIKAKG